MKLSNGHVVSPEDYRIGTVMHWAGDMMSLPCRFRVELGKGSVLIFDSEGELREVTCLEQAEFVVANAPGLCGYVVAEARELVPSSS